MYFFFLQLIILLPLSNFSIWHGRQRNELSHANYYMDYGISLLGEADIAKTG